MLDDKVFVEEPKKVQRVEYLSSVFKYNYHPGSTPSLNLLRSLENLNNPDIFETKFAHVIDYKWEQIQKYIYVYSMLYFSQTLIMAGYIIDQKRERGTAFVLFIYSILFLFFEVLQAANCFSLLDYFKSNIVDLSGQALILAYTILLQQSNGETNEVMDHMLLFACAMSFLKGISQLRAWTPTRYLIRMLLEVLNDMRTFLAVMLLTLIMFSVLFFQIVRMNAESDERREMVFEDNVKELISLILTLPTVENYFQIHWFFFVVMAVMELIVFLNLLIAIISDTFEKVQETQQQANYKEMCGLMLEVESLFFFWRNKGEEEYIHIVRYLNPWNKADVGGVDWEGKVKAIKKKISKCKDGIEGVDSKLVDMDNNFKQQINDLKQLILEQKKNK